MVVFSFSIFKRKYPFWSNLIQKIKIVSLSRNLVSTIIQVLQNSRMAFTFSVFNQKYSNWVYLVQNIKIFCLSLNLVPRLIQIYRIQW